MLHDKDLLTPSSFANTQTARYFREGSFAIATVAAICAFAYILFTVLLLDSSPIDRIGGMMFFAIALWISHSDRKHSIAKFPCSNVG